MKTDVKKIRYFTNHPTNKEFDYGRAGESVTMPLDVYEEIRQFCRRHGETDLPGFVAPALGGFVLLAGDMDMNISASQW